MIKIGVADYGLNVWYGNMYDYRDRLSMLKELDYDGLERLEVKTAAEAVERMADARQMGMDFGTCLAGSITESIRFSAALGLRYVWTDPPVTEMDVYCRQVNYQIAAAKKYGLRVVLHNHMGYVETPEQVETFLARCPEAGLLLDTAHMVAAGGDPLYFIDKYYDRLTAIHVKDFVYKDKNAQFWGDRIRFCELGAGELGDLNQLVIQKLMKKGYSGWIFVEHDTHLQEPAIDLKVSREFIRKCGI